MAETKTTTETYRVPECNLAELEARIDKLNKRAKRLGVPAITLAKKIDFVKFQVKQPQYPDCCPKLRWMSESEFKVNQTALLKATKTGVTMAWWAVEVTGTTPVLEGWQFVAVLEPVTTEDGETLNLIQCLPGQECPEAFRSIIGRCDHCKVARHRKQTFVVRHDNGETKCVGRQCIKDFLGYNGDPHQLATWLETIAELGDLCGSSEDEDWLGGGGSYRPDSWDLTHFLTLTSCRIKLHGWVSKGKAYETGRNDSTASAVLYLLSPPMSARDEDKRKWEKAVAEHKPTDANKAEAEAALEWCKTLPSNELETNNYLANINLVARCGYTSRKTSGLAASIIVAYCKAMELEIKRQQEATRPSSNHVGVVGKRQVMVVTCKRVTAHDNEWGTTGIHNLVDDAGNDLVWFASGSSVWLKEGETYRVKATPKSHGEFRGRKQTTVNRLAVVEEKVNA